MNLTKLPDVQVFPDLSAAASLRFVSVTSFPSLTDIHGLSRAPHLETVLIQDTPQLKPARLEAFLGHPTLKCIYPCLDFDGEAAVNKEAEKVLSSRFGTNLLDAETPEFSIK